jgi:hypothetical protein
VHGLESEPVGATHTSPATGGLGADGGGGGGVDGGGGDDEGAAGAGDVLPIGAAGCPLELGSEGAAGLEVDDCAGLELAAPLDEVAFEDPLDVLVGPVPPLDSPLQLEVVTTMPLVEEDMPPRPTAWTPMRYEVWQRSPA